jgi:formylglycine-generating enzyme required for sulfatase activity
MGGDGNRGCSLPICWNLFGAGLLLLTALMMVRAGLAEASPDLIGQDDAPMVLIPEGPFLYGKDSQQQLLPAFYIDKYEVSTQRYAKFIQATGHAEPPGWTEQLEDRPVVQVDWYNADAYCRFYGKRLPLELEWEKAARGTDGRLYPWGNAAPTPDRALYGKKWEGYHTLSPVDQNLMGQSPYGLHHMAGNVWEWTNTDFDATKKVLRGGAWSRPADFLRSTTRIWAGRENRYPSLGFRCVLSILK